MSEEIKFVAQFIIYPVITALVGVVIALYHRDLKHIKEQINSEKKDREEDIDKHGDNIGKIFNVTDQINIKLGEIMGKIEAQERICNIRHSIYPWDGSNRRKE